MALKIAILIANKPSNQVKIVRIQNTLKYHKMWISEVLIGDVERDSALKNISENILLE